MGNKKKYIITSITLGLIAASAAGLIGLTNLITKKQIEKNEKNKINRGIAAIFGENSSILNDFKVESYKYTNHAYEVNSGLSDKAAAFITTGSNMYGKISLLVGFVPQASSYVFTGVYMITDEQTYASTLEENYIDPLNHNERDLDDVSCGATYGAKLVRDMVLEATEVANTLFLGDNNG